MKKLLILILVIMICNLLSANADNKDVFTPKEYVLTLPKILQDEDTYEEKELALEWNQWHADVRNKMKTPINEYKPNASFIDYIYYVDKKGEISNIFVLICEKPALDTFKRAINKDAIFYAYDYDTKQFYKFKAYKEVLCNMIWHKPKTLASEMVVTPVKEQYVPIKNELVKSAENIKKSEYSEFYTYPTGSKRTKMKISGGWISSQLWHTGSYFYESSDFDDVEKIKYRQKINK